MNVFLLTRAQWSQAAIGAVLASSGLIGIMAHPAVGAFIDRTRAKRALIIAGAFVLSGCGLAIVWMPVLPVVFVADIIMAVLGGVFAPTVAAITLGLCGREVLPARLGRNAAFDRAGNVFIAAFIGLVGVSADRSSTPAFTAKATARYGRGCASSAFARALGACGGLWASTACSRRIAPDGPRPRRMMERSSPTTLMKCGERT